MARVVVLVGMALMTTARSASETGVARVVGERGKRPRSASRISARPARRRISHYDEIRIDARRSRATTGSRSSARSTTRASPRPRFFRVGKTAWRSPSSVGCLADLWLGATSVALRHLLILTHAGQGVERTPVPRSRPAHRGGMIDEPGARRARSRPTVPSSFRSIAWRFSRSRPPCRSVARRSGQRNAFPARSYDGTPFSHRRRSRTDDYESCGPTSGSDQVVDVTKLDRSPWAASRDRTSAGVSRSSWTRRHCTRACCFATSVATAAA